MSDNTINNSIDNLYIEYFQFYSELLLLRESLSTSVSNGLFDFCTARNDKPTLLLDSTQYIGRQMTAVVTTEIIQQHNKQNNNTAIELKLVNNTIINDNYPDDNNNPTISTIRHRVFTAHLTEREKKLDELIENQGKSNNNEINTNIDSINDSIDAPIIDLSQSPLSWFGLLIPHNTINHAKSQFTAALNKSIELANIQFKLINIEQKINELREQQQTVLT